MSYAQNGLLFDDDTGALLVTESEGGVLADGEYRENGYVKAADGSLSVIPYDADNAGDYYEQNGLLLDPDGRVVITEGS